MSSARRQLDADAVPGRAIDRMMEEEEEEEEWNGMRVVVVDGRPLFFCVRNRRRWIRRSSEVDTEGTVFFVGSLRFKSKSDALWSSKKKNKQKKTLGDEKWENLPLEGSSRSD